MFGLVEQNYKLPKEVLEEIGIETFDYDTFEPEFFEANAFKPETYNLNTFEVDTLDILFLRRGIIEVSKVGYID